MAFTINDEEVYPIGYYTPTGERKQPTASDGDTVDLTIDLSGVVNPVVTYYRDTDKTNIENVINRPVGYRSAYHPEDVVPFLNTMTLGGLNNLSPTLWLRRGYDTGKLLNGNMNWTDYTNSWIYGNNGIFTDLQAAAHPVWAAVGNGVADILTLGGAGLLKSTAGQYRAGQAATLAFNNGTWDYIVGATSPNAGLRTTLAESPWIPRTAFWQMPRGALISAAERVGVPKGDRYTPNWHVANYPGYLLKGLMSGSPLERQLSRQGTININLLNAYFNKASQIEREVANKVLAEKFAGQKTIDYNLFKKAVLDELISYERKPQIKYSDYGMNRIGFEGDIKVPTNFSGYMEVLDYKFPGRFLRKNSAEFLDTETGLSVTPFNFHDYDNSIIAKLLKNRVTKNTFTFESPRIPIGNNKHYDPTTLGHSRTYTTPDEPNILHVMESQSDWALARNSSEAVKTFNDLLKKIADLEAKPNKTISDKIDLEDLKRLKKDLLNLNSDLIVDPQLLHLRNNYLLRQLQENLRYAAENGLTKMRYPTSETAAKIEGYRKLDTFEFEPGFEETGKNVTNRIFVETGENPNEYGPFYSEEFAEVLNNEPDNRKLLSKIFEGRGVKNPSETLLELMNKARLLYKYTKDYKPAHKTILKKYADFPKLFLKLYKRQNVRIVTDTKGNTWYEVDVPRGYLNKEWLYKKGGILTINE